MTTSKISRILIAITSLVGLFSSIYLLFEYITGGKITCALVSGCDIVRASPWAWPLGIPMPLFGVLFYLAVYFWLVIRAGHTFSSHWFLTLGRLNIILGFIISVLLTFVEWLDIKNFCFWCLVSAACSALIFFLLFLDRQPPEERELKHYFILLLIFLVIGAFAFLQLTGLYTFL